MKNNNRSSQIQILIAVIPLSLAVSANAALIDRGGGLIYDADLNITWLANANVNGPMTWNDAMTWASNLSYYDSVRNITYTDWRLPTTLRPDSACVAQNGGYYFCTGSEMGHLFYNELGGTDQIPISTGHNSNYGLFQNIQAYYYWSGTVYESDPAAAWSFDFANGSTYAGAISYDFYAFAVRPGDVAAVPIPAAFCLFGSGLIGLFGFMRKRESR